jgi:hypothetical protein
MRISHSWIVSVALCASSICALTAVAQTSVPVPEALVPELTLGQVPGLVPSHVQGLAAELSPPSTGASAVAKTERPPVASIAIEEVPAPTLPTPPVQSADAALAEQVLQSVRQSLGKATGKDERGALAGYYAGATQPLWVNSNWWRSSNAPTIGGSALPTSRCQPPKPMLSHQNSPMSK